MLKVLTGVGIAIAGVAATSPVTVVCNNDNTIDVTVDFDKPAQVLEFKYGSCTKDNVRANLTQNASFGWNFQLDVSACDMDNKLRTLKYNQTALMRVGRVSGNTELSLAHFDIDSYCTYTSTYVVKYDYGQLSTESHKFASDAGLINLTFSLKSYNDDYTAEETHSKKAGENINLGLTITNANFNHAADVFDSKTGKVFAPQSCEVKDETGQSYTLFDHAANGCKNSDVDLKMSFSQADNMWRFSHMLFLIGNHRVSKLSLECVVIVCDRSKSADCDAVINSCIVHKDCATDGNFVEDAKCTSYYTCANGFRGAVETCATGTYYDVTQKVCTTVLPTGCHHPSCVANGDGTYRDDNTHCSKAYVCDKGTRTDYDCKAPTPFYQDGQCVSKDDFMGCEHPDCPSTYTGLVSDDPKCKIVSLCVAGYGWQLEDNCGETHYFDKSTNGCKKTNIPPPGCGTPNVDCLPAGDTLGKDYRGKWAETVQGGACIKWEDALAGMPSDTPTWPEVGDRDHAYCRNPDGDAQGPYCFVAHYKHQGENWSDTYQYCNPIPECT